MNLAEDLRRAFSTVCSAGSPEVRENGEWQAALHGLQYEVRTQGDATLLHLWSENQTLVRRVLHLAEESAEHLVLEVSRLGHSRSAKLEFFASGANSANREGRRLSREQFRGRLRGMLLDRFPDEDVGSLATAADLHHSISGSYTRGLMRGGSGSYAILAAAPDEDSATIDGILTFGLIWLDRTRARAHGERILGLRLFLPRRSSAAIAHRLNALAASCVAELFEYDLLHGRIRRVALSDAGNLATWIVPRREVDDALAAVSPEMERIRQMAPEAIAVGMSAGTRDITLRFRGMEFARQSQGIVSFGLGQPVLLTPDRWPAVEALVGDLEAHRHALASDTKHPLYRAHPERWLETLVTADPGCIDARLDPHYVYAQVPAFSVGERAIIDLLAVTRDGRLAVLELKASEDIHLVMQAVDYWLRVRWHHNQDDFTRYGYFPGVPLQPKAPLLILVAPGFRFHPANDIVLRYLSPEIEIVRIGLGENWRRSLRVMFRQ